MRKKSPEHTFPPFGLSYLCKESRRKTYLLLNLLLLYLLLLHPGLVRDIILLTMPLPNHLYLLLNLTTISTLIMI